MRRFTLIPTTPVQGELVRADLPSLGLRSGSFGRICNSFGRICNPSSKLQIRPTDTPLPCRGGVGGGVSIFFCYIYNFIQYSV